jgi:ABC-2 type transport system ATP-binding protein
LEHKATSYVQALSGGQRRRLEFALAIIGRPEILFLDEPTTGLDPAARRSLWDLINRLKVAGTTVVLATHFLDEPSELADRMVVMSTGRVVADDTPAGLGGGIRAEAMVRWREGGQEREARTADPTRFVLALADRLGGPVADLEVRRATIEDAYLTALGRMSRRVPFGTRESGER